MACRYWWWTLCGGIRRGFTWIGSMLVRGFLIGSWIVENGALVI
jgi:hypothetical protein